MRSEAKGGISGCLRPRTSVLYRITDHLGSIRAVRDAAGKVRQRFDYYPFGSVSSFWNDTPVAVVDTGFVVIDPIVPGNELGGGLIPEIGDSLPVSIEETPQSALRYRFGGKEIAGQKVGASVSQSGSVSVPAGTPAAAAGRPYLDFGARLYDPRTAAWLSQDPLSEKYYPISPYAYCAGNPVNLVDPDGMDIAVLVIDGQHIALLIQNNDGEWAYYSINGITFSLVESTLEVDLLMI